MAEASPEAGNSGTGEALAGATKEDHYVYMNGKCEAILLGRLYPDELSRERTRRAYAKANPDRRVEVRCRAKKEREE